MGYKQIFFASLLCLSVSWAMTAPPAWSASGDVIVQPFQCGDGVTTTTSTVPIDSYAFNTNIVFKVTDDGKKTDSKGGYCWWPDPNRGGTDGNGHVIVDSLSLYVLKPSDSDVKAVVVRLCIKPDFNSDFQQEIEVPLTAFRQFGPDRTTKFTQFLIKASALPNVRGLLNMTMLKVIVNKKASVTLGGVIVSNFFGLQGIETIATMNRDCDKLGCGTNPPKASQ
jgi:hypothetical protein